MGAVVLSCTADFVKLQHLIRSAFQLHRQGSAGEPERERRCKEQLLRRHTDAFLEALTLCTTCPERNGADEDTVLHPAPEVQGWDAELADLQSQVMAAAQRIAGLQVSAPALISSDLSRCLEARGPVANALDASLPAGGVGLSSDATALSPAPSELQGRVLTVVAKMSTLRARLEEALQRLQRVIEAVEGEAQRGPPCTVERALRGSVPRPTASAEGGVPSPKLGRAIETGRIATRRRAAKDLQPLPFPLP